MFVLLVIWFKNIFFSNKKEKKKGKRVQIIVPFIFWYDTHTQGDETYEAMTKW